MFHQSGSRRQKQRCPLNRRFSGHLSWEFVEMGGIEPPSDGRTTGLLRVQLASVFLGPGVSREQGRRRAQSMKSPKNPTDTGSQQWLPR